MSYDERLKRLVGNNDPFWYTAIDKFVEATYEDKEQGINEIENLYKDRERFNQFTKQLVQRRDDLKSVKEEFFMSKEDKLNAIQNSNVGELIKRIDDRIEELQEEQIRAINIEEIVNKLVENIKNLDDDTAISISKLLEGNEISKPTMFQIYDMTINKLKEIGLYLNFGDYENERVGLPFNIPFKKGYITSIKISERVYNGKYHKGSIFTNIVEFNLSGGNANIKKSISFCIDEKIKDKATLESLIPFNMTEEEIVNLNNILSEIKNKYQPYDKDRTKLPMPEYLKYTDIEINGVDYAVNHDDEIYSKLRKAIKSIHYDKSLNNAYDALINNEEEDHSKILKLECHSCKEINIIDCSKMPKDIKTLDTMCKNCKAFIKFRNLNYEEPVENNLMEEQCICGNVLNIIWEDNKKFQMVRCPKCNNEMKFKNPNIKDVEDNAVFTSYVGFDLEEMRKLILDKTNLLQNKLNGNINDQEKENAGYLLWNCRMILRNISMTCDKITNKYKEKISQEEFDNLTNKATIIKTDEPGWVNMDSIRATFEKINK